MTGRLSSWAAGRRATAGLAVTVLALLALVALAGRAPLRGPLFAPSQKLDHQLGVTAAPPRVTARRLGVRPPATLALPLWLQMAALAAAVGAVLLLVLRLGPRLPRARVAIAPRGRRSTVGAANVPDPAAVATLRDAVDVSIEDLRADPNARRAVIRAYRLMETTLGRAGLPRDPAEAPREYLGRALGALTVTPDPPRRLTRLYERARFSDGPIDLSLRDQAIDALVALRDQLDAIAGRVAVAGPG